MARERNGAAPAGVRRAPTSGPAAPGGVSASARRSLGVGPATPTRARARPGIGTRHRPGAAQRRNRSVARSLLQAAATRSSVPVRLMRTRPAPAPP